MPGLDSSSKIWVQSSKRKFNIWGSFPTGVNVFLVGNFIAGLFFLGKNLSRACFSRGRGGVHAVETSIHVCYN